MISTANTWEPEIKARTSLLQILVGAVVGTVLGVGATLFLIAQRVAALEEQMKQRAATAMIAANTRTSAAHDLDNQAGLPQQPNLGHSDKLPPEQLQTIIQQQQRVRVKLSYGEAAYQAFTDDDLKEFVKNDVPGQVREELKHNNSFIAVLLGIKELSAVERQRLLKSYVKPLHPTWAQLGRIGPDGQTEAGQRAEILVASSIVDLAKELLKLSPAQLERLYE